MTTLPIPKIIPPLVRRHAEDAAFYWGLLDASIHSASLDMNALSRFGDMLDAHLEGLQVAGQDGWAPCLAALQRWRKPADAFVSAHQAFRLGDVEAIASLLVQIRARPDELLRGVISALAWLPLEQTAAIVRRWTAADSEVIQQVAALRASALLSTDTSNLLGQPIERFLVSPDAHVRAAACRATVTLPPAWPKAALTQCLGDSALAVRAEAAIALHALSRQALEEDTADIASADTLWRCIVEQIAVLAKSTGWYRQQSLRRLQRWVQHLAVMLPLGHATIPALLDFMPPRISLRFIAYHGNSAYLPYSVAQMSHPDSSRYAGWVWQTITGVNLESAGLCLPEPPLSADDPGISDARVDADHGLPLPDMDKIARFPTASLPIGQRCLLGQILTPQLALDVLQTAPQAHRNIASLFLLHFHTHLKLPPRGHVARQLSTIRQLRHISISEGRK